VRNDCSFGYRQVSSLYIARYPLLHRLVLAELAQAEEELGAAGGEAERLVGIGATVLGGDGADAGQLRHGSAQLIGVGVRSC
jgi:hypothetical protein